MIDADALERAALRLLRAHGVTADADADRVTSPAIENARATLALVDALRAERDRRDALAGAVLRERAAERTHSDASIAYNLGSIASDEYDPANECWMAARAATDALLSGATPDVVRAGVVRRAMPSVVAAWLRRHDALAGAAELANEAEEEGAAVIGAMVDAALAAVKETP